MRETYIDDDTAGIINLSPIRWDGVQEPGVWEINRVNTPGPHRRQGIATKLMQQMIAEAEKEQATLWLWIHASGKMTYSDLADWYNRLGFRRTVLLSHTLDFTGAVYVRWPSRVIRLHSQRTHVSVT